jgi:hypothetical protein
MAAPARRATARWGQDGGSDWHLKALATAQVRSCRTELCKTPCPQTGHPRHVMYNPRPVNEALGKGSRGAVWGHFDDSR